MESFVCLYGCFIEKGRRTTADGIGGRSIYPRDSLSSFLSF